MYTCRHAGCTVMCSSRQQLYIHKMNQHGYGENQQEPWNSEDGAPWSTMEDDTGRQLRSTYMLNKQHILRQNSLGAIRKDYNFPTNDLREGTDEIMNYVKYVFEQQSSSFKFNMAFGLILRNEEDEEFKYFIPYTNATIFPSNLVMSAKKDLLKISTKLQNMDISDYIRKQRPSTKWRVAMVTNVLCYVYSTGFPLGSGKLPEYIVNSHVIKGLECHRNGKLYKDNLCAFRCLAAHRKQKEETVIPQYYHQWAEYFALHCGKAIPDDRGAYEGVNLNDMHHFENCFSLQVTVAELKVNGNVIVRHHSSTDFDEKMYLNVYDQHLSYITNFSAYAQKFECPSCNRMFKLMWDVKRHLRVCSTLTKYKYPGGHHKAPEDIFSQLEEYGINVSMDERFFPWFGVYDFEAILKKNKQQNSDKLTWTTEHVPISVSICSNVPEFKDAKCIINPDTDQLIEEMVEYFTHISAQSSKLAMEKWSCTIDELKKQMKYWEPKKKEEEEEDTENDVRDDEAMDTTENEPPSKEFLEAMSRPNTYRDFQQKLHHDHWDVNYRSQQSTDNCQDDEEEMDIDADEDLGSDDAEYVKILMFNSLKRMYAKFMTYCEQLPILGFNSSSYDLNLVKAKLGKILKSGGDKSTFTVKKSNKYLCLSCDKFKLLDITQYLAPGCSYAKFLKAYQVNESKSYFPYEWFDCEEKLDCANLPPYSAFYSHLQNVNMLEQEVHDWRKSGMKGALPSSGAEKYVKLQWVWIEKEMETFREYVEYYNNLDVAPFVTAVKISISVPGVARNMLYRAAKDSGATFTLFPKDDEDMYKTVKTNICGGPSIIYNRYHSAGETLIRGNEEKTCQKILGYDANSLYLWCLSMPMPTGHYARVLKYASDFFCKASNPKYMTMYHWMDYVSQKDGVQIRHKLNTGHEKRIGPYLVDGYDSENNHIYEVRIYYFFIIVSFVEYIL